MSVNIKDLDREANDDFKIVFVERTEQITTTSDCLLSKDLAKIPDKKYYIFRKNLKLKIDSLYRVRKLRSECGLI